MKNQLNELLGMGKVQESMDLFPYLSMRQHTLAQYFFEAKSEDDIVRAIQASHTTGIPVFIIGGGSNIVFKKTIKPGLVILNTYSKITQVAEAEKTTDLCMGSGTPMPVVILHTVKHGLSGLEEHKGLPGTVGGAVYTNSKWTHPTSYVGDNLIGAQVIDREGNIRKVDKDYFQFTYDYSKLQDTKEVLLSATFRFQKKTPEEVARKADESFTYRKKTQPVGVATCGCFFRNITDEEQKTHQLATKSAGYFIDKAGMKGAQVGSFRVSDVHANFIINEGGDVKPRDLQLLVEEIKSKVKDRFGIELKEEVEIM